MTASNIVKTNIYLADMGDFVAMNEVYGTYFTDGTPPATVTRAMPHVSHR